MRSTIALMFALSLPLALAGCGSPDPETTADIGSTVQELRTRNIPFTVFQDDIGTAGETETRRLFKTSHSYHAYFGHDAPVDVDFTKEWVVFYSAGVENTGGYDASIDSLRQRGRVLIVTTALESPGPNCIVTEALTKPYVLAKFDRPTTRTTRYHTNDTVRDCKTCVQNVFCIKGSVWSPTACRCVPAAPACATDADCRLFSDYCTGCDCRALGIHDPDPVCPGPGVRCFADPCATHAAACVNGSCTVH